MTDVLIRGLRAGEADALGLLFHRAVREGAAPAYSPEQRAAWSPQPPAGPDWAARLEREVTLVAEADGIPVGFMSLEPETGYLDLAFVLPEWRGQGVAGRLLAVLENRARALGLGALSTQASALARPFLLRNGWQDGPLQEVVRGGVTLHNYGMSRVLVRACA
ncbi:GNAT family N-acetyltransferase [Lutimaribacter marinistellae]|uniref:GNAT family N-acetyltransferase n=1 Tax=Lutimaribacter marinistellae TaxID=1820329 RepID=A0ABV7TI59_9RHOB